MFEVKWLLNVKRLGVGVVVGCSLVYCYTRRKVWESEWLLVVPLYIVIPEERFGSRSGCWLFPCILLYQKKGLGVGVVVGCSLVYCYTRRKVWESEWLLVVPLYIVIPEERFGSRSGCWLFPCILLYQKKGLGAGVVVGCSLVYCYTRRNVWESEWLLVVPLYIVIPEERFGSRSGCWLFPCILLYQKKGLGVGVVVGCSLVYCYTRRKVWEPEWLLVVPLYIVIPEERFGSRSGCWLFPCILLYQKKRLGAGVVVGCSLDCYTRRKVWESEWLLVVPLYIVIPEERFGSRSGCWLFPCILLYQKKGLGAGVVVGCSLVYCYTRRKVWEPSGCWLFPCILLYQKKGLGSGCWLFPCILLYQKKGLGAGVVVGCSLVYCYTRRKVWESEWLLVVPLYIVIPEERFGSRSGCWLFPCILLYQKKGLGAGVVVGCSLVYCYTRRKVWESEWLLVVPLYIVIPEERFGSRSGCWLFPCILLYQKKGLGAGVVVGCSLVYCYTRRKVWEPEWLLVVPLYIVIPEERFNYAKFKSVEAGGV